MMVNVLDKRAGIQSFKLTLFTLKAPVQTVAHDVVPGEHQQRVLNFVIADLTCHQGVSVSDPMALKIREFVCDKATQITRIRRKAVLMRLFKMLKEVIGTVCKIIFTHGTAEAQNISCENSTLCIFTRFPDHF